VPKNETKQAKKLDIQIPNGAVSDASLPPQESPKKSQVVKKEDLPKQSDIDPSSITRAVLTVEGYVVPFSVSKRAQ